MTTVMKPEIEKALANLEEILGQSYVFLKVKYYRIGTAALALLREELERNDRNYAEPAPRNH